MPSKPKKNTTSEKNPENFSIKNAISHANKLLAGFDNTSIQIQKMSENMKQKVEKLEEHNRDLRQTLSGITNAAEHAIQDAKLARTQVKVAAANPVRVADKKVAPATKPAKTNNKPAAKPAKTQSAAAGHTPVRELIQQFITKNGASSAKDIFHYVSSQQKASRAAVYQMLKKHFHKKGDGTDAMYSISGKSTANGAPVVTDDEAERFIQKQSTKMEKDLNVS